MNQRWYIVLSMMAFCFLGACVSGQTVPVFEGLSIQNMQTIPLNVMGIDVVDSHRSTSRGVDQQFQTTAASAAEKLIRDKLQAAGSENILRAVIDEAEVTSEDLPVSTDIFGSFVREPSERMNARVVIRFELVNEQAPDIILGHATVIGKRTKTLMENTSLADRDRAYEQLLSELTMDLYDGFESVVRRTFGMPSGY